jgi:hypothetical protein
MAHPVLQLRRLMIPSHQRHRQGTAAVAEATSKATLAIEQVALLNINFSTLRGNSCAATIAVN